MSFEVERSEEPRPRPVFVFATVAALIASVACGDLRDDVAAETLPIIGGSAVTAGTYPAIGAIVSLEDGGVPGPLCTGTLIDESHVLTAAHCVALDPNQALGFSLSNDTQSPPPQGVVAVASAVVHPAFVINPSNGAVPLHDIAVLTLSRVLPLATFGALPTAPGPVVNDDVTIVGFGPTSLDLSPVHVENAAQAEVTGVSASEFVVGSAPNPEPCFGDSGGPALSSVVTHDVVGVASRAIILGDQSCSMGAVYTRVDAHLDWIGDVLRRSRVTSPQGCSYSQHPRGPEPSLIQVVLLAAALFLARHRRCRNLVSAGTHNYFGGVSIDRNILNCRTRSGRHRSTAVNLRRTDNRYFR
jgi:secreted trypsin-like serine protease